MNRSLEKRLKLYTRLSSSLSEISTEKLIDMLEASRLHSGWGSNHAMMIGNKSVRLIGKTKVFAKKIPLTQLEFDHSFETRNLFKLPTYYNYGVGSAGFGAFRELLTHIKTTNWVLENEHTGFPLMYHYRIIPKTGKRKPPEPKWFKMYTQHWNSNAAIKKYIQQRSKAPYEIVIFLEHFPYTVENWLPKNSNQVHQVAKEVMKTLHFLNQKRILHFDAHINNILTDGQNFYLTDFGLCLDRNFNLSPKEKVFFDNHTNYDFAQLLGSLGFLLELELRKFSPRAKKKLLDAISLPETDDWRTRQEILLSELKLAQKIQVFKAEKNYFKYLERNRNLIMKANGFFYELRKNPKKNTPFENLKIKKLISSSIFR